MALLSGVNDTTRNAVENFLDTFTNGPRYLRFCHLLIQLDKQAKNGDTSATELLEIIHRTSRLIDLANRQ